MKRTKQLTAMDSDSVSCCGMIELHTLKMAISKGKYSYNQRSSVKERLKSRYLNRTAYIATTIPDQKDEIAELVVLGFKAVGEWTNPNTGRMNTLWLHLPKKKRNKRD